MSAFFMSSRNLTARNTGIGTVFGAHPEIFVDYFKIEILVQ